MATEIAAAYVELGARITGLERGLKDASRQVDAFGTTADKNAARVGARFQALGSRMSSVGRKMTLGLTLPIVGIGAAAFKMAADFERSMSKITGLVGIARGQVDSMRKGVLDLSRGTGKSASELADGLFVITSAGLRGKDAMDALGAAGKASTAGLGEVSDIGRAVAGSMNAYGAATLDAARATDIITATARAGNFETSQLAAALGKVLPFAKQAGASLEQVGGAVALLTRTNGNASESITQMTALFRAFVVPTEEGKKILDQLGTSAGEVRQQIGKEGLVSALQSLDKGLGGNREQLGRLLGSSEAAGAAFQILDADARSLNDTFGVVGNSAGMTDEAFAAAADTAQFKMQQALANMQSALIELGGIIAPVVSQIASGISSVVGAFTSLPGPVKTAAVAMAAFVAAVGPLLWMGGKVIGSIGAIKIAMAGMGAASAGTAAMGTAAGGAAGKVGMLGAALPLMANPLGLAAGIAVAGAVGLMMFGKRTDFAAASANNLATATRNVGTAFTATNQAVAGQPALNQQVAASSAAVIAAKNGERQALEAFLAAHAQGRAANESEAAFQMRLVSLYKQVTSARLTSAQAQGTSTEAVRASVDNVTKLAEASNKEIVAARQRVEVTGRQAQMDQRFAAGSAQSVKSMAAHKEATAALAVAESRRGERLKQVEKAQVSAREAVKASSMTDAEKAASLDVVNRAIAKTRGEIKSLPESKTTTIKAKNDATATIEAVKLGLSGIDRFVTVTIKAIKQGVGFNTGGFVPRFAGGGTVRGPGGVDRVPAMLTAGEVVLTKRQQAMVNGGMNIRDAIRKTGGAFAKGGFVAPKRNKGESDKAYRRRVKQARAQWNASQDSTSAQGISAAFGSFSSNVMSRFDTDTSRILAGIEANFQGTGAVAGMTFKSLEAGMRAAQKQLNATFDALTPAEAQMKALQEAGQAEDLQGGLDAAKAKLAEAQAMGDSPTVIAEAQREVREAERAMMMAELSKTAEAERALREQERETAQEALAADGEEKRALLQQQLDERLAAEQAARDTLREQRETELMALEATMMETAKKYRGQAATIQKIMQTLARRMEISGRNVGKSLAVGLDAAKGDLTGAARGLADLLSDWLRARSPTKVGPMSSLDTWWAGVAPALVDGIDSGAMESGLAKAAALEGSVALSGSRMSAAAAGSVINLTVTDSTLAGMSREQADRVASQIKASLDRQIRIGI